MTIDNVQDITPREQYTASAGQTVFSVPFPFQANGDVKVYVDTTLQTITTDYTLTGAGDENGGTCTFVSGLTAGDIVTIYRDSPFSRDTDYTSGSGFSADGVNNDLDNVLLRQQELELHNQRTLKLSITDTTPNGAMELPNAAARANGALVFDANGDVGVSQDVATSTLEAEASATAAAASEAAAQASEDEAEAWAIQLTTPVEGVEYSSKENAIGDSVPTGSAKAWAVTPEDEQVGDNQGNSALHYAAKAQSAAAALTIPDSPIYNHPQVLMTDATIPADYNGWVVGPWSVDPGATLTIEAGANFYVQPDPATLALGSEVDAVEASSLQVANNLSDVASAATARTNLDIFDADFTPTIVLDVSCENVSLSGRAFRVGDFAICWIRGTFDTAGNDEDGYFTFDPPISTASTTLFGVVSGGYSTAAVDPVNLLSGEVTMDSGDIKVYFWRNDRSNGTTYNVSAAFGYLIS